MFGLVFAECNSAGADGCGNCGGAAEDDGGVEGMVRHQEGLARVAHSWAAAPAG